MSLREGAALPASLCAPEGLTRRRFLAAVAASPLALSGLLDCGPPAAVPLLPPPEDRRFSFLAVGDTGKPQNLPGPWSRQNQAGRAMARLHRADPVDGLVLLGDNFYPDGLVPFEAEARIGENLVAPYSAFVRCTERARRRFGCDAAAHPVPIDSVPGNHDHGTLGLAAYQARVVPHYVANFTLYDEPITLLERPGISLILMDTVRWDARRSQLLAKALRASRGPLRALVSHLPIANTGPRFPAALSAAVLATIRAVGRTVHLHLCGHEHNLQVYPLAAPGPLTEVIVGGGSSPRPIEATPARRLFAWSGIGFARVDVMGGEAPRLQVTLYAAEPRLCWWTAQARPLASVRVSAAGDVAFEEHREASS